MFPRLRHTALAAIAAITASGPATVSAQNAPTAQVEVIGTSPLAGLGVDRNLLPYASQTVRRGALDQAQGDNMTDFLARRLPGMQVNDIQGSPFQADLTYRGYRASGLLGASQGLSVYLDGVRINEPFGDVINWDMVPEFALQSLTVLPGANPSFGLNTLGGAIVLETVDGRSAEGLRAEAGFGSHGRQRAEVGLGQRHADGWHSYVGGTVFDENGWRDQSPGRQALVLARLGRSQGGTDWSVGLLGGSATLVGNGLLPSATLDEDGNRTPDLYATSRSAVFTHPDRTKNRLAQATFNLSQQLAAGSRLQALAYARNSRRDTVNGDGADDFDPLVPDENASLNTTATRQSAWGAALSLARRSGAHQWQVGASVDASRVRYRQLEQEGRFDASRGVLAGDEEAELSASVTGKSLHLGLYATDTWQLAPGTHVTATLRANRSRVSNTLTTVDDDTGVLEAKPKESFTYTSLNPALGITQQVGTGLAVFANLARNTRVPTVIELGCADPDEPCRLPVGLQSDPYLKQVRATSLEAGLRWRPAPGQRLELALFRTDNRDDIVFRSVSAVSQLGYFQNFQRTRHQGLDTSWQAQYGPVAVTASYSHLQATYQAHGLLRMGERNVTITPGTRMAGLPRHSAKLGADWALGRGLRVGADMQIVSSRGVQGNEDGLLEDGATEVHRLSIPGHTLLHLRLQWQATPALSVVARVTNALDKRYETYGALAETVFDARGKFTGSEEDALFVAPGAPRSLWLGLRLTF
ncbi:TonB-dependent receptor [Pseudaquabacterium pictum]|uniref:TonB-dependent receptor n=1 Tax=Pseudaquabacterium pictum TaxID=2315236 RepID=A0A480ATY5_9BURK|nr:TonB-dependent receptor [Rubrivivax pictus]GCL63205.1 TonB-dependent receptor [Rubrivivax pictus]